MFCKKILNDKNFHPVEREGFSQILTFVPFVTLFKRLQDPFVHPPRDFFEGLNVPGGEGLIQKTNGGSVPVCFPYPVLWYLLLFRHTEQDQNTERTYPREERKNLTSSLTRLYGMSEIHIYRSLKSLSELLGSTILVQSTPFVMPSLSGPWPLILIEVFLFRFPLKCHCERHQGLVCDYRWNSEDQGGGTRSKKDAVEGSEKRKRKGLV